MLHTSKGHCMAKCQIRGWQMDIQTNEDFEGYIDLRLILTDS